MWRPRRTQASFHRRLNRKRPRATDASRCSSPHSTTFTTVVPRSQALSSNAPSPYIMSANAASSSKVESPAKVAEPHKDDDHPAALGVLEEDDEFEEFPVAGTPYPPLHLA